MIVSRRAAIIAGLGAAGGITAGVAGLALSAGDPAEVAPSAAPPGRTRWSNWSGLQTCVPAAIAVPADAEALQELLRTTSGPVRAAGAGHSFTALVPTAGTIVSVDRLNEVVSHDPAALTTTVGAGIRLYTLGEELWRVGQSMNALPDINKQTLAGAISTATHGTGRQWGALSSAVTGLEFVTADGRLVQCDATNDAELFSAARVSLGALGIITKVRLQNRPRLILKRRTWFEPIADTLESAEEHSQSFRHFEFYYVTFTGMAYCIAHEETTDPETPRGLNAENQGTEDLMTLRDWLWWAPWLRRLVAQGLISNQDSETAVGPAWRLLSTDRPKRFHEMEYHIPRDALRPCLEQIIQALERHNEVYFPIEVRFIDADDAWLSPFYMRPSASIAVHMGHTQDHALFYSDIEPIFRRFDGRPHWGKLHGLKAADLARLYPRWNDFVSMRSEYDPRERLLNAHLRELFGAARVRT